MATKTALKNIQPGKAHAKTPLILIVEDDQTYARIYQIKLSQEGFRVTPAADGNQALEVIKREKPDLILLDLIMPGKDGFETLKELKADANYKDIPVIAFSNVGQDEDIGRAKQLGIVDYLVKTNLSVQEMVEKVKEHLHKA